MWKKKKLSQKNKRKIKKIKKQFSLRQRFHYWWCDVLNLVSMDEFHAFCEQIDRYLLAQNRFNQIVGERLKLRTEMDFEKMVKDDKSKAKDSIDRGMFG